MATPIIVNPTKPSQVVVNGTQKSGTPITINTDLDYNRVQSMIDDKLKDIDTTELAKQGEDPEATNTAIFNAVNTLLSRSVRYDKDTGNLTIENVKLIIE